ncbi:MAG TPA: O-succinylhomoserine sulfhydrylase, partial [Alphaproteobacteria bacterium]|nr:O-succinylhomoserine sulfhydrylase [Alphaproteobacteria bacterium]
MFEERMALIEGAEMAKGTASGLAAVHASLMCFLRTGDHVVAARALFGGCRFIIEDLLPRFGITVSFVDGRDLEAWEQAIRPQTKALFLETPSNPTLEII